MLPGVLKAKDTKMSGIVSALAPGVEYSKRLGILTAASTDFPKQTCLRSTSVSSTS